MRKTNLFILAFIVLMLFSCKKDEVTPDLVISGSIIDFKPTIADSVIAFELEKVGDDYSTSVVAKSEISPDGKFSLKLTPSTNYPFLFVDEFNDSTLTISDLKANANVLELHVYKSGINVGFLYRTKKTTTAVSESVEYISSDRVLTITGSRLSSYSMSNNDTTEITYNNYNMIIQKGWNAMVKVFDKSVVKGNTTLNYFSVTCASPEDAPANIPWELILR